MYDTSGPRFALSVLLSYVPVEEPAMTTVGHRGSAGPSAGAGTVLHQQFITFVCNCSRVGNEL